METIGLFGGSFDPIHNGHLAMANAFAEQIQLDTVVFLPAGNPYHKNGKPAAARHRLAMLELAIADNNRFAVSDCDIVRHGATYTYDTVQIFRQHFPEAKLWWLMGMDSLMTLHSWKNWSRLVQQIHIAVAVRPGSDLAELPEKLQEWFDTALNNGSLKFLDLPPNDISSTQVRTVLSQDGSTAHMLPESVSEYIRQHRLYRNGPEHGNTQNPV